MAQSMIRHAVILEALLALPTFTLPAVASGDAPVEISNRRETQADITRILLSDRSDKEKLAAIARLERISDPTGKGGAHSLEWLRRATLTERLKAIVSELDKRKPVEVITPGASNKNPERPNDEDDQ